MIKVALFVRLEAKPGQEEEVATFLRQGLSLVQEEPSTVAWFGIRLGPSTSGIFDAFPDEAGREAHLSGVLAAALKEKTSESFLTTAQHRESGRSGQQASARGQESCLGTPE